MSVASPSKTYLKPPSGKRESSRPSAWQLVGPVALAVLAYSGQLGASSILGWVPGNVTLISWAVVVVAFALSVFSRRWVSLWTAVPLGLWLLFLFPAIQFIPGDYQDQKMVGLLMFGLVSVIASFELLRLHVQRVAFLAVLATFGIAAGVLTLVWGERAAIAAGLSANVLLLDGANTIGTARLAGTGALILIAAAVVIGRGRLGRRVGFIVAGLGLLVVMVATGSRGPLAGIIVGITALILLVPAMRGRRVWSLILLGLGTLAAYAWASSRGYVSSGRAFAWLAGERDTSTQAREHLWDVAVDHTSRNPIGTGWGGFTSVDGVPPGLSYPHNLFLEVYVEAGWLIGTAVLVFVAASLWRLMRRSGEPVAAIMFVLAAFAVANAMVSGDINDNRLLWILLGSAWVPLGAEVAPKGPGLPRRPQLVSP